MTIYKPPPQSGFNAAWSIGDSGHEAVVELRWDNEAWVAECYHSAERINYVIRLSPTWHIKQYILFRDLDEPDLWLATDGAGRWGEMNGAHRTELDGCRGIDLAGTPFTNVLMIHQLPLEIGDSAEIPIIHIDVETLATRAQMHTYTRVGSNSWRYYSLALGRQVEVDVDDHGFVINEENTFIRTGELPTIP